MLLFLVNDIEREEKRIKSCVRSTLKFGRFY